MASVAELERLTALTQRLIPISQFQRGTLIRADDWNLLIAAVIELARAVFLDTDSSATNDHEHADEVDIGWLTPRLRTLIEQGGLSDPVANRRLINLERNNEKNNSKIDESLINIGKLRSNIDDVKINDIGREGDLTILRRQFEAQSDSRDEVLDLRISLDSIKDNINKALEIGDLITVNGQVADINNLFERITDLETLGESLTGSDGNVLDASSLEIQLAELQTTLVSQEQLDEALDQVRIRPPQDIVDILQADLHNFVEAELTQKLSDQQTENDSRYINNDVLSAELNTRDQNLRDHTNISLSNLSNEISTGFVANNALDNRLQSLSSTLTDSLSEQINTAMDSRLQGLQTDFDARYISNAQLNTRLADFSTGLQTSIMKNVQGEITNSVQTVLQQQGNELFVSKDIYSNDISSINKRIDDVRVTSLQDTDVAVAGLQDQFVNNDVFESRLNAQKEQLTASNEELINKQLNEQITTALSTSLDEINGSLDQLGSLENKINTNINNQLNGLRQEISKISQQAVATEIQGVQNNLRTMQDQVNSINTRINLTINETVSNAVAELQKQVQSDLTLVQQNISSLDKRLIQLNTTTPVLTDPRREVLLHSEPESLMISDFTQIKGLGSVYAQRLRNNNINHFSELAKMTTVKLAAILKISEARVERLKIQEKAAAIQRI